MKNPTEKLLPTCHAHHCFLRIIEIIIIHLMSNELMASNNNLFNNSFYINFPLNFFSNKKMCLLIKTLGDWKNSIFYL